jgi:hypothetical protein
MVNRDKQGWATVFFLYNLFFSFYLPRKNERLQSWWQQQQQQDAGQCDGITISKWRNRRQTIWLWQQQQQMEKWTAVNVMANGN